ncbi:MAG: hypothetical protein OXI91_13565 [Chloroflexota bacterium]|nr:hypothetical protein [Chloroflexota bacterium]
MEVKLDGVLIGRILAGVVILLALISAIVGAAGARSGGFDLFLARLTTPLGVGFLIIVATEILRVMDSAPAEREEETGGDGE